MATKVPSGTGCIGINHGNKQVNAKWEIDNCLNRHHFICRKKGQRNTFRITVFLLINTPGATQNIDFEPLFCIQFAKQKVCPIMYFFEL